MGATSVGGEGAVRSELPSPELPAPAGWGAVAVAAVERAQVSSGAARAGTVGAGPAYLAMPARTGYEPRAEAFAAAERGYAGAASPAVPSATASAKATATASRSSASKTASKTSSASPSKASSSKSSTSKSATSKTSTSKSSTSTASSAKAASAELAFLDDPHVSVEDKLFRFMTLMQKKADAELVDAMKRYEEKKAAADKGSSSSGSSSSAGKTGSSTGSSPSPEKKESGGGGGGGLFGMLGDALGGLAKTVVSGAESLAKDLGGPVLAAGATAVGLPFLAPVALQIGGTLAKSAVSGLASAVGLDELGRSSTSSGTSTKATTSSSGSSSAAKTTSTSKSTSTSASKAGATDDGVFDEKLEMLGLQRLVEKQQTMFAALSNVLKAQHDGQMVAVNNIR